MRVANLLSGEILPAKDGNANRAEPNWPPAVVAGAYQTGVLGVRNLKRRGVKAYCFDCNPSYPGFKSVYGPALLAPDPDKDPDAWIAFMIDLARELGERPVLMASADQFVSAIHAHSSRLAEHYLLSPGVDLQGLLATKETQYDLAAKHGMPLPRTQQVNSEEGVIAFSRDAEFPCLLKPIHFREWQVFPAGHPLAHEKIAIAKTPGKLLEFWRLASEVNPNVMLQEIIQGPDTAKRVYVSCYSRDGKRISNAIFRELRCDPVGFGPASVTEPVVDDEADAICDNFLRSIGYSGICEIEVKRDARDGKVKLIEANPRLSGGGDAAPYAGVDTCWLHYLDMIGQRVTPVGPSGKHFRHVVLRSDLKTVIAYHRRGLISLGDIVRSYRGPLAFYDFDMADLRYSAETLYVMAKSGLSELIRPKPSAGTAT